MAANRTVVIKRGTTTRKGWTVQRSGGINGWTRVGQGHYRTKAEALAAAETFIAGFREKFGVELTLEVA